MDVPCLHSFYLGFILEGKPYSSNFFNWFLFVGVFLKPFCTTCISLSQGYTACGKAYNIETEQEMSFLQLLSWNLVKSQNEEKIKWENLFF